MRSHQVLDSYSQVRGTEGDGGWFAQIARKGSIFLIQREVESVAAASVVDLHQQPVLAGLQVQSHVILVRLCAARNVVGPHLAAVEPYGQAVVAAETGPN